MPLMQKEGVEERAPLRVRVFGASGTFAAVAVVSIATAALTSLIFLAALTPQALLPASSPSSSLPAPESSHEAAIEAVVERASPAVVSVVATKDLPIIERYYANPFESDPFFEQFFGEPFQFRVPQYRERGTERREVAGGTGFIVSQDGLLLTNRHVVDIEDAEFTVVFSSGDRVPATVVAKDPVEDLAVLRIDRQNLTVIPLGDSDALIIGQTAIAIGNTLGEFQNTVSVGVISGLNRKIVAGSSGSQEVIAGAIQTDAAINPGNSGGPLLNLRGEAIGINTAIVVGSQSVGFAIPINKANKSVGDVKATGKISYAYLGVRYVDVTNEIREARGLSVDRGALIVGSDDGREPGVAPGSPAAKAGLREGDVILSVSGEEVSADRPLASFIQTRSVGETVTLRVWSDGAERDVPVTLAERPSGD